MSNEKGEYFMDINSYIYEAIFDETPKYSIFYSLIWEQFKEDGFVVTDEPGNEIDCIFKAVALQNLLGEFAYRVFDEVNETGFEDAVDYIEKAGFTEEDIFEYCEKDSEIETDRADLEATAKNALDRVTELTADKMLEDYSPDDIFDMMFTATYDFEQDFTFDFEDTDEFLAFVDANSERLDSYKDEYSSAIGWIEGGMVC